MKKLFLRLRSIFFLLIPITILSLDNAHFWRATNFLTQFYEPRLEKPWLQSIDVTLGYGKTESGRNGCGDKTELLNIYGFENFKALGIGVPGKDLSTPGDVALMQLQLLPNFDDFGKVLYAGRFSLFEVNLMFTQNFNCGFFGQAHIPYRNFKITEICFCDRSPTDCTVGPNQQTPQWQTFLNLLPSVLAQHGFCPPCGVHHKGFGDLSLFFGWTHNYEETIELDFVDTTFRIGVLIPTGHKIDNNIPFDIANGYNGHFGVPVMFDFAVGMYEWLTTGFHFGALVFASKTKDIRMKTDAAQNGWIKLAQGPARVTPGIIWEANFYLKADHFVQGFSLMAGLSIAHQKKTQVVPCQTTTFDPTIVCCDSVYFPWRMYTIQLAAEYDFARLDSAFGPRVGIFYNIVAGGQRIFNTNMAGGQFGFDMLWCW